MTERQTFVIGDTHGHIDRLEALLMQEGLLAECETCDGAGYRWNPDSSRHDCDLCSSTGLERQNRDSTEIVMVGDIGHWGRGGSPTGDIMTLKAAINWADVLLWGNHDRALVDAGHAFSGYQRPDPTAFHLLAMADFKLAHEAHGYLITHAGVHDAFRYQKNVSDEIKEDPAAFAAWLNEVSDPDAEGSPSQFAVRDAISSLRGGFSSFGGILWRDVSEKLYDGFMQIFGHSADRKHQVRYCDRTSNTRNEDFNYTGVCIDVGGKGERPGDECLAGIWLPSNKIARIDL